MTYSITEDELIKQTLKSAKTIAMVGVSSIKKEVSSNIKRRPSVIVMKYLQEFGYRVIPVNPFSVGKKIYGEDTVAKLEDISIPIDIVDVFRPSNEAPGLAEQTKGSWPRQSRSLKNWKAREGMSLLPGS